MAVEEYDRRKVIFAASGAPNPPLQITTDLIDGFVDQLLATPRTSSLGNRKASSDCRVIDVHHKLETAVYIEPSSPGVIAGCFARMSTADISGQSSSLSAAVPTQLAPLCGPPATTSSSTADQTTMCSAKQTASTYSAQPTGVAKTQQIASGSKAPVSSAKVTGSSATRPVVLTSVQKKHIELCRPPPPDYNSAVQSMHTNQNNPIEPMEVDSVSRFDDVFSAIGMVDQRDLGNTYDLNAGACSPEISMSSFGHDIDVSDCVYSTEIGIKCQQIRRDYEDAMQRYKEDTDPAHAKCDVADYIQPNGCYKTSPTKVNDTPLDSKTYTSDDFKQHQMDSGDVYFTLKNTNPAETGLFYFSMDDSAYLPFEDEAIMTRTLKEEEQDCKPSNLPPLPHTELTDADLYDINDPLQRELYGRDDSQGPHRPPVPVLGPNVFETLSLSLDPTDEELYGPSEVTCTATTTSTTTNQPMNQDISNYAQSQLLPADHIKLEQKPMSVNRVSPISHAHLQQEIKTEVKEETREEQTRIKEEQNVKALFDPVGSISQVASLAPTLVPGLNPTLAPEQTSVDQMEIKVEPIVELPQPRPPILQPHLLMSNDESTDDITEFVNNDDIFRDLESMDHTEFMSISPVPDGDDLGHGVLADYSYDPLTCSSIDPSMTSGGGAGVGSSSVLLSQPMHTLGQFTVDSSDDSRLQAEHSLALKQTMDTVMNTREANTSHSDIENSSMYEFLEFPDKPSQPSLTFV